MKVRPIKTPVVVKEYVLDIGTVQVYDNYMVAMYKSLPTDWDIRNTLQKQAIWLYQLKEKFLCNRSEYLQLCSRTGEFKGLRHSIRQGNGYA